MRLGEFSRGEVVPNFNKVLLWRAKFSGADCAAKNDDGEEETQEGDLAMADESVDLSSSANSDALLDHSLSLSLSLSFLRRLQNEEHKGCQWRKDTPHSGRERELQRV